MLLCNPQRMNFGSFAWRLKIKITLSLSILFWPPKTTGQDLPLQIFKCMRELLYSFTLAYAKRLFHNLKPNQPVTKAQLSCCIRTHILQNSKKILCFLFNPMKRVDIMLLHKHEHYFEIHPTINFHSHFFLPQTAKHQEHTYIN